MPVRISERAKGVCAMTLAGTIWGLSPIPYKYIIHIPSLEVTAHRVFWSFVIFTGLLVMQGRLGLLASLLYSRKQIGIGMLAAGMVSINWLVFILAVQIGKTAEASLGYFLFPFFAVFMAWILLGERFSRLQWVAVAIAALSVALLTFGLGVTPWIAVVLATTFSVYGICKVRMAAGPTVSVALEVSLVMPFALAWIIGTEYLGWTGIVGRAGGYFGQNFVDTSILIFSGAITAGPLILMSYAAKRLRYSDGGLILYINPTLQFLVAVLVFKEGVTIWHAVAFPMIWVALCIYTVDSFRRPRISRSSSINATTESFTKN